MSPPAFLVGSHVEIQTEDWMFRRFQMPRAGRAVRGAVFRVRSSSYP
jgi:hypothetical protein